MAKRFTGMNVREVNFNGGQPDGSDGIAQGVAGVGIRPRVDENAIGPGAGFVDMVNEDTFMVGLVDAEREVDRGRGLFQFLVNLRQG